MPENDKEKSISDNNKNADDKTRVPHSLIHISKAFLNIGTAGRFFLEKKTKI